MHVVSCDRRGAYATACASPGIGHIIHCQDALFVRTVVIGDGHTAASSTPMVEKFYALSLDERAIDTTVNIASDGIDDLVHHVSLRILHEEAECAGMAAQSFFGGEAGDMCPSGIDGSRLNAGKMGYEIGYFPGDIGRFHAQTEEAAATIDSEGI